MRVSVKLKNSFFPKKRGDLENNEVDYEKKNFSSYFKCMRGGKHDRLLHRIVE